MATLVLVFWGTSILFSIVAALVYNPTNNVEGFPFLHILSNIYYLSIFKIMAILTGVRWYLIEFWFAFLNFTAYATWLQESLELQGENLVLVQRYGSGALTIFYVDMNFVSEFRFFLCYSRIIQLSSQCDRDFHMDSSGSRQEMASLCSPYNRKIDFIVFTVNG